MKRTRATARVPAHPPIYPRPYYERAWRAASVVMVGAGVGLRGVGTLAVALEPKCVREKDTLPPPLYALMIPMLVEKEV